MRIKDRDAIASFVKGDGIRRRCAGGLNVSLEDVSRAIDPERDYYLAAMEGGTALGMVVFSICGESRALIHLCLRTIGKKTRHVFAQALEFAKRVLKVDEIIAAFPTTHRACYKLADDFHFIEFHKEGGYVFQILKLT